VAAAQPVVRTVDERREREDARALFVVDTSRSMLASRRPGVATRFDRAQAAAQRLRAALPEMPTGLASLTDRMLPLVLPTADARVFSSALVRALAVDSPPPQQRATRATTLDALRDVVAGRCFPARIERRLVVVFTDGATQPLESAPLVRALRRGEVLGPLFVHVWRADELVFGPDGVPEPGYRPDRTSGERLDALARSAGGRVFGPGETKAAADAARRLLGEGSVTHCAAGRCGRSSSLPTRRFRRSCRSGSSSGAATCVDRKRRGWDLNPRDACARSGFQDCPEYENLQVFVGMSASSCASQQPPAARKSDCQNA
jgi:hypothetical protein